MKSVPDPMTLYSYYMNFTTDADPRKKNIKMKLLPVLLHPGIHYLR